METKKNTPIIKERVGRFQISIWKRKRLIAAKNDFDAEREVETVRACIQYGRRILGTDEWVNQSIWCDCDELRNLARVLDQLNNTDEPSKPDGSAA